jgi:peroxiredoxin
MVLLVSFGGLAPAGGAPKVGDRAPDFSLADQGGTMVRLSEFVGKKRVVVVFYIKAFTPT